ncbi:MAG: hypothetical protein ACI35Q_08800 [Marinilabiliaceae bacterium]
MKKEAIIDLIKGDLEEIGTLVETFREPDRIAKDFIDLLRQKCEGVGREISLLSYWSTENMPEATTAELAARVGDGRVAQDGVERKKEAETPQPDVRPAKSQPASQREEISDYFADELDQMDDPFADIKFTGQQPDGEQSDTSEEEMVIIDRATAPEEPEHTESAVDREPLPAPKEKAEVKSDLAKTGIGDKEEPTPATRHAANATDIATYGTPVSDITKAIGINDRFLYQRELFKGNKADFDTAIAAINSSSNYNQAYIFLKQSYGWDETDSTVEAFLKAVHRRFI